ncbi:hypothetical protein I203_101029 [Kwoniella mangroviensis CBS 8507]|uniref:uncharacterized protein n=1 Tax=Kwoniella mangroviensis CBS 8507 TaxID=1296122 RepID=UPI00080CEFCE|nr:uncharacterized protein I203_02667 [Kwoniella mangroviensis CBS 8507]OCF68008.1 hypothetical protein I203_02667 [Kwoniella mangroviensis CBS 8507]
MFPAYGTMMSPYYAGGLGVPYMMGGYGGMGYGLGAGMYGMGMGMGMGYPYGMIATDPYAYNQYVSPNKP